MKEGKRLQWVDIAKGLAIILVVVGHLPTDEAVKTWLYTFHMPLFFMLSGLFLVKNTDASFKMVLVKRYRRLMVPFVAFNIAVLIPFFCVIDHLAHTDFSISHKLLGVLLATRSSDWTYSCYLWFLPCLFVAGLLVWSVWKYLYKARWLCIGFITIVGGAYNFYISQSLPFSLDIASIAVFFIAAGVWLANHSEHITHINGVVCLIITIAVMLLNGRVDMWAGNLGCFPLFLIGGTAGSLLIIKLSMLIPSYRILLMGGGNSLIIYALHFVLLPVFRKIYEKMPFTEYMGVSTLFAILCAVAIILILVPIGQFVESRLPWLVGIHRSSQNLLEPKRTNER